MTLILVEQSKYKTQEIVTLTVVAWGEDLHLPFQEKTVHVF